MQVGTYYFDLSYQYHKPLTLVILSVQNEQTQNTLAYMANLLPLVMFCDLVAFLIQCEQFQHLVLPHLNKMESPHIGLSPPLSVELGFFPF